MVVATSHLLLVVRNDRFLISDRTHCTHTQNSHSDTTILRDRITLDAWGRNNLFYWLLTHTHTHIRWWTIFQSQAFLRSLSLYWPKRFQPGTDFCNKLFLRFQNLQENRDFGSSGLKLITKETFLKWTENFFVQLENCTWYWPSCSIK